MASIRILHASDLHIALADQRRSPLHTPKDAIAELLATRNPKRVWMALRKLAAASSYDRQVLEHLAEFIIFNAKELKPNIGQLNEVVAERQGVVILKEKLDAIVLTGDLATTGKGDDLDRVVLFLKGDYDPDVPHRSLGVPQDSKKDTLMGATISAVKSPIVIVPGNHDRYSLTWSLPTFMPGGTEFDEKIVDYRQERVQRTSVPSTDNDLRVVIFTADFTLKRFGDHKGGLGWIAQGKVYNDPGNDILGKLVEQTRTEINNNKGKSPLCILWAVHFPPEFPGQKEYYKLLDGEKLLQRADALGVRAILAGHTHKQKKYGNKCKIFCCGTTTQYEPLAAGGHYKTDRSKENRFQILTISVGKSGEVEVSHEEYRYAGEGAAGRPRQMHWRKIP